MNPCRYLSSVPFLLFSLFFVLSAFLLLQLHYDDMNEWQVFGAIGSLKMSNDTWTINITINFCTLLKNSLHSFILYRLLTAVSSTFFTISFIVALSLYGFQINKGIGILLRFSKTLQQATSFFLFLTNRFFLFAKIVFVSSTAGKWHTQAFCWLLVKSQLGNRVTYNYTATWLLLYNQTFITNVIQCTFPPSLSISTAFLKIFTGS